MNRREAIKAAVAGISAQSGIEFTGELLARNDDDICMVIEIPQSHSNRHAIQALRDGVSQLELGIPIVVLPYGLKMRIARRSEVESVI